ncbi:HD domain-containing protein [Gottfriedia acidiceleris]|uniref:HD domain-containing protein n=1 Tax=Gottfriedia acidiceleris TaxID=371036 RepID=UPI00339A3E31
MSESRVRLFEQRLSDMGYTRALEALDWMKEVMCAPNYARHDGSHYYYHLVDVAQDLFNHGIRDEDILIGALTHDAVEDVPEITLLMIEYKFGKRVAKMVDLVTKEKGVNYKQGDLIKVLYLDQILLNPDACLLKVSDRKHNFSTLKDATAEKKMRQAIETETYFFPFFKEAMERYPRYSAYFLTAKTAIKPHLMEMKERYAEVSELKDEIDSLKGLVASLQGQLDQYAILQ